VLFETGAAELSPQGLREIAGLADLLREISQEIPAEIDWILRVDGHTDNIPIVTSTQFANNWELSQARALSVVLYLNEQLDIPAHRLLAAGFGEHRPIASNATAAGRAANRRIEFKLTER
jgi:chemotaxis protein MotB